MTDSIDRAGAAGSVISSRWFTSGALLLGFLAITLAAIFLFKRHEEADHSAEVRSKNLATVLAADIERLIGKSEVGLWAVAEEYRQQIASPAGLNGATLTGFMTEMLARLPEVDYLRATDPAGILRYGPGVPQVEGVDISDREYFLHFRDNDESALFIAKPVKSRISGKWVLPLALRMTRQDSSFGGVVFASVALDRLTRQFAAIDAGKRGVITLFNSTPSVIARFPEPEGPGSVVGATPASPTLSRYLQSGEDAATYRTHSSIDGIERTFSLHKVGGHALFVSVGLAREDYLADWRGELFATSGFTVLFLLVLTVSARLLGRSWEAQEGMLSRTKQAEVKLKSANIELAALWSAATLADATLHTVANHINASITRITGSNYGFYGFLNEDESVMTIHSWSGAAMQDCALTDRSACFPIADAGVWAEAVRQREPFILNDYAGGHPGNKGLPAGHVPLVNLLVVPSFSQGRITAVAAVANRAEPYGQEDVARLSSFLVSVQVVVDSNQARAALRDSEEKYRLLYADLCAKTAQLEDLTANLEKRVEEETATRTKNERILVQQSKLAAMGEMMGAIAHQWRQPLNALGMIIQNIKDAYTFGELDKEYIDTSVQKSMLQIRHMSKTIDDFRNFFLPDKEIADFDAMRAVGDVLRLLSAQLAASGITYRLTCHNHGKTFTDEADIVPCEAKTVRGFRNEFEHVVMNLVNNARDAILEKKNLNPGQTPEQALIAFDFRHSDRGLLLEISDTGGGIRPEIIDRIFEPYFTTKDPSRGTGLGLYMSKVIMEHMNGALNARNGEQGAVFILELPGAGASSAASPL